MKNLNSDQPLYLHESFFEELRGLSAEANMIFLHLMALRVTSSNNYGEIEINYKSVSAATGISQTQVNEVFFELMRNGHLRIVNADENGMTCNVSERYLAINGFKNRSGPEIVASGPNSSHKRRSWSDD